MREVAHSVWGTVISPFGVCVSLESMLRRLFLPLVCIGAAAGAAFASKARCVPSRVDHCGRYARSLAAATVPRISSVTSDGALSGAKGAHEDVQLRIRDAILSRPVASIVDVADERAPSPLFFGLLIALGLLRRRR